MKKMGAFEVKTHLSKLLEDIQKGEEILITKRGEPIAKLVPYEKSSPNAKTVISSFRKWRRKITWNGKNDRVSIKDAKEWGRR